MSRLEDALRATFAADAADADAADPDRMSARVRDGVRRRRNARRRATVLGAGALVVILVAAGAVLGLRGSDGPPSPTGRHDLRGLDTTEWPEGVQQIAVADRAAFAAAESRECACTVLHRYADGAWSRRYVFDGTRVVGLGFAPDGEHGWAVITHGYVLDHLNLNTQPSQVVATSDGGATWAPLQLPPSTSDDDGMTYPGVQVAAQDDGVWVAVGGEGVLRWFPAGSTRGEVVALPGGQRPSRIAVAGDALLVTADSPDGDAATTTDRGRTWTPVGFRCAAEDFLYPSDDAVFAQCSDDQTLYRWAPGTADPETYLRMPIEAPSAVVPVTGGRVVVLKDNLDGWVVSPDGTLVESHGPPESSVTGPTYLIDGTAYLATFGGVYRADGDGERWVAADGSEG